MQLFARLDAVAVPIAQPNVDTDQRLPARYLRTPRATDFCQLLFRDVRFRKDASEEPEFVLDQGPYRQARIVVAGRNFGCGSSREHAVWALDDYGIRAAIAPTFGDIFFSNALKNGLLPIVLPGPTVATMLERLLAAPASRVVIDLRSQMVAGPDGSAHGFPIDPFSKHCLLHRLDELGYTLTLAERIADFERRYERGDA
jgi:3-isopropylmalate/(R)-2-methylmalate dehydratase small subunit